MTPVHHHRQCKVFLFTMFVLNGFHVSRSEQTERMQEHNTDKFIECIRTAHNVCGENNLVAIKVTALIRPNTLRKFNHVLKAITDRSSLPSIFEMINEDQKTMESFLNTSMNLNNLTADELAEIHKLLLRLNRMTQVRTIFSYYWIKSFVLGMYRTEDFDHG